MIFSLEFGKIFKRKFNYLFGMIILLISFLLIYKTSSLAGYYDLDEVDFIFKFTFKILLILILEYLSRPARYPKTPDRSTLDTVFHQIRNTISEPLHLRHLT